MRTAQSFLAGLVVLSSLAVPGTLRGQDDEWNRSIAVGDSAMAKQQFPEAEAAYREGLAFAEKRWKKDARISASLLKVAQSCNAQGEQEEAEALAKRSATSMDEALKAHKARDSSEEYQQLTVSSALFDKVGALFAANQHYQDAEEMYQKSLNRWQEYVAKPEPKKKNNEDALRFMTQALANAPQKYVDAGIRLEALYEKQGKSDQAKALCQQLASATGGLYELNDPQMVPALTPIATAEVRLGDYSSAEPLFKRAIDVLASSKYKDNPDMASALENYAVFLKKIGREDEAKAFFEKANLIRAKSSTTVQSGNKPEPITLTCYKPAVKVQHFCGVVMNDKQPVADATVSISKKPSGGDIQSLRTSPSGEFDINELTEGTYWMEVANPSGTLHVRRQIQVFKPAKSCEHPIHFSLSNAC